MVGSDLVRSIFNWFVVHLAQGVNFSLRLYDSINLYNSIAFHYIVGEIGRAAGQNEWYKNAWKGNFNQKVGNAFVIPGSSPSSPPTILKPKPFLPRVSKTVKSYKGWNTGGANLFVLYELHRQLRPLFGNRFSAPTEPQRIRVHRNRICWSNLGYFLMQN